MEKYNLTQKQSLPLEAKIKLTKKRIEEWCDYWDGEVYLSYSGGKDSTVLLNIIKEMGLDIPVVFIDTGLEYPEIRKFAIDRSDIVLRPKLNFKEVLVKYGYPVVSKRVAQKIYEARNTKSEKLRSYILEGTGDRLSKLPNKWRFLLNSDFKIHSACCDVMKKRPAKSYEKETNRKPIIGNLASESRLRTVQYYQHGCSAFNASRPTSNPLSIWLDQDILKYLHDKEIEYCSVYGEIAQDENEQFYTTGCNRTGCIFCAFGVQMEEHPNKFEQLKETHPSLYDYCMRGGQYVDGVWQPSSDGLGMKHVLETVLKEKIE